LVVQSRYSLAWISNRLGAPIDWAMRAQTNIDELLVALLDRLYLLDRLNPDDKAQFLVLVLTRDLPTAGSRYIYAR
jgi:hypothetical protein